MSNKKIMIIGAGALQVPAILTARDMGIDVAAIDMDHNAIGFKFANECYNISTLDIERAVMKAAEIKPDGVMTLASDMPMRTVAAIAENLGLNSISMETAIYATNKARMRERLREKGVPIPQFFVIEEYQEYEEAVHMLGGKAIVKPADNSGSRGVFLIHPSTNLSEAFAYSKKYSRSGEILVEEYMSGSEVSVETITFEGKTHVIAITDKLTTGAPNFVEMGHSVPAILDEDIKIEIERVACAAVDALGIDKGPSHTEIKVTEEGPKIVELGARLGGDNITTHLVPLATGVNMVKCSINIALGLKPDVMPKFYMGSAIRYFDCNQGRLVSIDGDCEARSLPGVHTVEIQKPLGGIISNIRGSTDRIGYVIAQAETPQKAVEICNNAIKTINISVA